jgi:hypothetical protein
MTIVSRLVMDLTLDMLSFVSFGIMIGRPTKEEDTPREGE